MRAARAGVDIELALRWIGLSHLLQLPLTLWLARRLELREAFETLPPLAHEISKNMAFAAVALPTALGIFLAVYAGAAVSGGPMQSVALGTSLFWTWRLYRQLRVIGPLLKYRGRAFHPLLAVIFVVQGPVLCALLLAARAAR